MTGKVWLVGAGPGDVGLLTLKGREVLEKADVVVYDALVGQGVLGLIPDSAKLVYAGKRSGSHFFQQEEINRILLEEALQGNRVIRLKGGDPFVFGRGGEELELLAENGVPFEIVPGVTSAFAVPAYNGIPVTHRDFCSSVHIITGHRRRDHAFDIDFDALVRTKGTLVFLMGMAALPDICRGLLDAGMAEDMPAAVLERGTTAAQRRVRATLGTLEEVCAQMRVAAPAVIVVGQVCTLADAFAWVERRPLAGIKVLLTRPKDLVSQMAALLREKGAEVLEMPAICTERVTDTAPMQTAIETLANGGYDWLGFTSPSGVRIFLETLLETRDLRALSGVKLAAIGRGTQKALRTYGLKADFLPTAYDGRTFGAELAKKCTPGSKILIPRAAAGNPALVEELSKSGALEVTDLPIYDTVYTCSKVIDQRAAVGCGEVDFAVFTSASTVRGFAESMLDADYTKVRAVCIGQQTAEAAKSLGMRVWISETAALEALAQKLEEAAAELRSSAE